MGGIYKITNTKTLQCYIGKTRRKDIEEYANEHFVNASKGMHPTKPLYVAIRSYKNPKKVFSVEIILSGNYSVEKLNRLEKKYIKKLNAHVSLGGYNKTRGGDGGNPTSEGRKKNSEKSKAMWEDSNFRNHMAKVRKELWKDEEFRVRMKKARIESWTDERREDLSRAYAGDSNPNSKLTESQIVEILKLLSIGWCNEHVYNKLGLQKTSYDYINELRSGKTRSDLRSKYPKLFEGIDFFKGARCVLNPDQIEETINILASSKESTRKLAPILKAKGLSYNIAMQIRGKRHEYTNQLAMKSKKLQKLINKL